MQGTPPLRVGHKSCNDIGNKDGGENEEDSLGFLKGAAEHER